MTKSNAQLFVVLRHQAGRLSTTRQSLEKRQKLIDGAISGLEERAVALVKAERGFEVGDLVVDDMGVVYRVTAVQVSNLGWRYSRKATLAQLTKTASVRGIALSSNGLPRWREGRTIRGKLRRYAPETL